MPAPRSNSWDPNLESLGSDDSLIGARYEPLERVGRGGQGEVLLALDHQHQRKVAIKVREVSSVEDREELLSEARTLLNLTPHRGLPLVRDDFFEGDRYLLVMDWIDGRNLAQILHEEGAPGLPYERVCGWLSQVAEALDHLNGHRPPVMHRDVKPANVVVTKDGMAVLVDFGLGGRVGTTPYGATAAYLAPELGAGGASTAKGDIFALGVMAWELLTGHPPYPGVHADWSSVHPEHVSRVERSLKAALAVDPEARHSSAGALVRSLLPARPPTNLPATLSSFVGREFELVALEELLTSTRLLTLTGVGGSGKTRLAQELARQMFGSHPGGVWFCDFSPLLDPGPMHQSLATALGVHHQAEQSLFDSIVSALKQSKCLVILDNCEHLIDASATLAEALLGACPDLKIIATSREPLRLPGEVVWPIPPLDLPDDSTQRLAEAVLKFSSVQLFCDRARGANPSFIPNDENAQSVADVCIRLDGIPLALELAAALTGTKSVEEIARELDDRFAALTSGYRTALPRQQTLQATLDWSYNLLAEDERSLLRKLSVFAGGFSIEAVERVVDLQSAAPLLARLSECSLLMTPLPSKKTRFQMLETVRQHASQKSKAEGDEESQTRMRHLSYFLELAQRAFEELKGEQQPEWLRSIDDDLENFRAALSWTVEEETRADDALALAHSLSRYWMIRGSFEEAREWLVRALARPNTDARLRGRAMGDLAGAEQNLGDYVAARSAFEESLRIARELDDKTGEAEALNGLSTVASLQAEFDAAASLLEEVLALSREESDPRAMEATLHNLGVLEARRGNFPAARSWYQQALEIAREIGNPQSISQTLNALGNVETAGGDYVAARLCYEESLATGREIGDRSGTAATLINLGTTAYYQGELDDAAWYWEESLALAQEIGEKRFVASVVMNLGSLKLDRGTLEEAQALFEQALSVGAEMRDQRILALAQHNLGIIEERLGAFEAARSRFEQALGINREIGDREGTAETLQALGTLLAKKDRTAARAAFEESLSIAREIDYPRLVIRTLQYLGELELMGHDLVAARVWLTDAAAMARELGEKTRLAQTLIFCAKLEARESPDLAAGLLGAADEIGQGIEAVPKDEREKLFTSISEAIGEPRFMKAYQRGRQDPDRALAQFIETSTPAPAPAH